MNISIPALGGAQVSRTQGETYLCVHYPRSEWCEGRGRDGGKISRYQMWWPGEGEEQVTRVSSHRPRVKCTHVLPAPGETARGKMWNIHQGSSLQHLNQHLSFMISDQASIQILHLNTGMYLGINGFCVCPDAPSCLWCEPRSQFLSTYVRAWLWWGVWFLWL